TADPARSTPGREGSRGDGPDIRGVPAGLTPLGRRLTDLCAAGADRQIATPTPSFTAADHARVRAPAAGLPRAATADEGASDQGGSDDTPEPAGCA
ncbi:hypothetical protein ACFV0T_41775, partial [Streptomyces sp. NPDC059582]|uniref:hypothetical protein n=1 Tax=Streptomyces sp. NPDC059582 TaxID=3346875 RepID=UPI00369D1853